jgi:hypothetical protein
MQVKKEKKKFCHNYVIKAVLARWCRLLILSASQSHEGLRSAYLRDIIRHAVFWRI